MVGLKFSKVQLSVQIPTTLFNTGVLIEAYLYVLTCFINEKRHLTLALEEGIQSKSSSTNTA